jgi:hypothetical protein
MTATTHRTECAGPDTVPQLLRLLNVKDATIAKQWGSLMAWLSNNRPSPRLWRSLLSNGYGLQLEQEMRYFQRPIPVRRITATSGPKSNLLLL